MRKRALIYLSGISLLLAALFLLNNTIFAEEEIASSLQDGSEEYILPNGLTLVLKEDHRTPTFAASLFIRTGSATEGIYEGSGVTHFIEHMIFKGTPTRNAIQIEDEIRSLGADIGAYTSFDYTSFKMEGPSSNILPLLDIFYDIVANP